MTLFPGQILNNRYRIVKTIGQGGFGTVYQSWDMVLNGICVVKENQNFSLESRKQFLSEAQILFRLRHTGLPVVHEFFEIEGQGLYLVMDFIGGQNLETIMLSRGGEVSEVEAINWIGEVCDALNYLHKQNPPVIHRDIKPQNIIITPENRAVLVDFGVAKVHNINQQTTLGARAVTPGFSPPEQYLQTGTDVQSDIYSLGATLYMLLGGKVPPESVKRLMHDDLLPLCVINPAISPLLEEVTEKALSLSKQDRFINVDEFLRSMKNEGLGSQPNEGIGIKQSREFLKPIPRTKLTGNSPAHSFHPLFNITHRKSTTILAVVAVVILVFSSAFIVLGIIAPRIQKAIVNDVTQTIDNNPTNIATSTHETETINTPSPPSVTLELLKYIVRENDTLTSIAATYNVSVQSIKDLNGLTSDILFIGQTLIIPTPSYTIEPKFTQTEVKQSILIQEENIDSLQLKQTIPLKIDIPEAILWAEISPDNSIIAIPDPVLFSIVLLDLHTQKTLQILEGHTGFVNGMDFSPDGSMLASSSADGTVRLWLVETGAQIAELHGHNAVVNDVVFSPDGKSLASSSNDFSVIIWEIRSGKILKKLFDTSQGISGPVFMSVFSPDGLKLATSRLEVWDVESGALDMVLYTPDGFGGNSITYSNDGSLIAFCSGTPDKSALNVWRLSDKTELMHLNTSDFGCMSLSFSIDDQMILVRSSIFSIQTGIVLNTIPESLFCQFTIDGFNVYCFGPENFEIYTIQ